MSSLHLLESEEPIVTDAPHLSHSRVNRYLTCPEQYRLYYIEGLRPKKAAASLVFGKSIHEALASFFHHQHDAVAVFDERWREAKDADLSFSYRESWDGLLERGKKLLETFVRDEAPKLGSIDAVERPFELTVTSLNVPFVGIIDLVAHPDGERTVIDFKTAGASYADHEVAMADQLTAYHLADPWATRCAFCVLVKTKEPKIEWYWSSRTPEQLTAYLAKVGYVGAEIADGRFYQRPGKHCAWCDFLPVCLGDRKAVAETLVEVSEAPYI